jgi:2,3-dihydroxybenzoate decarboxylase
MKIIDLEAHFFTRNYCHYLRKRKDPPREEVTEKNIRVWYPGGICSPRSHVMEDKLLDVGENRILEMDKAGIEFQVLSLANPGVEQFEPADGTAVAKDTNDELAETIKKYPNRYMGLAALGTQEPDNAAAELERAIGVLGFKGAKINSHSRGEYLDNKKYWAIFEAAQNLGVPIYLHPNVPAPALLDAFADYDFALAGPPFGFGIETSVHVMRLICSGLFDAYPKLKMVLGHMGEGLPFWLYRIDFFWLKSFLGKDLRPSIKKKPSEYIKENFLFTSSGMHFLPAFNCAYQALGGDRLAFGADHPFETSQESLASLGDLPICESDREKFYHRNAEKLFNLC